MITRRTFTASLAAPLAAVAAPRKETAMNNPFQAIFEKSMNEKKGVNVHVNGQSIGMLVTRIGDATVEGRSQQFSMIVIRLDRIDAATIS